MQVACVNLASCMTNILLEQSDHEDNANNNIEEGETIKCEYVGIFLDYLEHQRFEYGDDVTQASYYSMFTLCWTRKVSRGMNMVLQLQEKLS